MIGGAASSFRGNARNVLSSLLIGFCAAALLCAPAQAQDIPQVPTPLQSAKEVNGVNVMDGKIKIERPTLSIPAAPRLTFDRSQISGAYIVEKRLSVDSPTIDNFSVQLGGGTSLSFHCVDYVCENLTGDGSKLKMPSGQVVTIHGSGAVYHFNLQSIALSGTNDTAQYYASSADYPDGETINYGYDTATLSGDPLYRTFYRLRSVSTSLGYTIAITYQGSDFNGDPGAWQTPTQATLSKDSAPLVPLGQLTYGTDTTTDLAGRVFTCSGCNDAGGSSIEDTNGTMTLPGMASASLQVTKNSSYPLVAGVTRDGVAYSYGYTNPALVYSNTVYDKLNVTGPASYSQEFDFDHVLPPGAGGGQVVNRLGSSKDSLGRVTTYGYDPNSSLRLTSITAPEGNRVEVSYDDFGNITQRQTVPKPGSGQATLAENAYYNITSCDPSLPSVLCYRPSWTTDARGNRTDYTWASHGGLLTELDPADTNGQRRKVKYTYTTTAPYRVTKEEVCAADTSGTELTCGTANSFVKTTTYQDLTRLPLTETVSDGLGGGPLTTTYSYDDAGHLLSKDGPLPGIDDASYYRYNSLGRRTWEIGPQGESGYRSATRTTYRAADDQVSEAEAGVVSCTDAYSCLNTATLTVSHQVVTDYSTQRLPTKATLSSAGTDYSITQTSYDARNRKECVALRMDTTTWGSLPSSACTLTTANPTDPAKFDRITQTAYDAASHVIQVRKALGTPIEIADVTYSYTPNGKIDYVIDANGNSAEMHYDGYDRQDKWTFPSTTRPTAFNNASQATALATAGALNPADYEAYGYDANGNRTSLRKRDGSTITYQYDAMNRMTVKVIPNRADLAATNVRDVYYQYDIRGLQTRARFDSINGEGLTTAYDPYGRATSNSMAMDGATRTLGYLYDAAGDRTRITLPDSSYFTYAYTSGGQFNQLLTSGNSVLIDYNYNTRNELSAVDRYAAMPAQSYSYDPVGRLSNLSISGTFSYPVAWGFTRNPASQITSETQDNDTYSWTGHVDVDRTYTANGLNQYTAAGSAGFCYDADGNLTADGSSVYKYDVENRLVEKRAQGTGNSNCASLLYTGALQASLRYDPLGRLYETTDGATGAITRFTYDGDALVAEYSGAGTLLRRYLHGPAAGADDPLVWYEGSQLRMLYPDPRGSIVLVEDSSNNTVALNSYDEYGIPVTSGSTDIATRGRFRYTGQAWLPELGMYYYKARIYSPTLGRFLQTDPVGYADQFDLYAYVGDDPVNGVDPTGMCPPVVCGGGDGGLDGMEGTQSSGSRLSGNGASNAHLGSVSVTYAHSGVTVTVKAGSASATLNAGQNGASASAQSGDAGVDLRAGKDGASASAHAGSAGIDLRAGEDGASASAHAGSAGIALRAGEDGASASAHAGSATVTLKARTIQPEKVPREYTAQQAANAHLERTGTDKQVRTLAGGAHDLITTLKDVWHALTNW